MTGYLRTLFLFYRRHLRVQPLRELMAIAGVAAGVALLFAVQVAHRSITGSFEEIAHGVAGNATLELASRGPEGFDKHVAEEVQRLPDVKVAVPVFQQPVVAVGPYGRRALTLVGATLRLVSLDGSLALQFLQASTGSFQGALILTEPTARAIGVKPGQALAILARGRTTHLTVKATVPSHAIGAVADSPIAAATLPVVATLAGLPNRVTRVLIEPNPSKEATLRQTLSKRYPTLNARPVQTEAQLLGDAAGPEKQVTLLFSAISLVAGVILAYNALLLASDERRRFIVYLIETGTPDSMIVASLTFDALILGLAGSLIGLLAGDVISLLAYHSVPGYITAAFAIGGQRIVESQTILIGLAGGMIAAFAAAALPAIATLRASANSEPEAVGHALSLTQRLRLSDTARFGAGALLVCLSIVTALLAPTTTVIALVTLAAGLVICLPLTLRTLLRLAHTLSRRSGDPSARLAVAELRGSPARSVALLATGTIAVFLAVVIGGSVADVQRAVDRGASDLLSSASIWIKPGGPENVYTTQPFPYATTQQHLQHVPGVRSVLPWRDSFLDLPGRRVWVLGVPPQLPAQIAPSQLIEGSLVTADRHLREGGWATLSQTLALQRHLHLGQRFTIPTPTGIASLRLAAITANYGWLSGAIVINGDEHARLWNENATASQLAVTFAPGTLIDQGKHAIEAALPVGSALSVQSTQERRAEVSAVLGSTLSRLNDITVVVLIAAIASVIASMIAATRQRQDRLDSLMSIGMGFNQFARLVFYESGAILIAGCLIGMAAGLTGQYLIDGWLHHTTGSPVTYTPAWQLGLHAILIAATISILASLTVALQTIRAQPRAAFSTE
jgi:putative ABC transport system permease protein